MGRVVVAGGGLVGPLLALMMQKRGHQVTLLEKRSDPRQETNDIGRSINLVITSRGLNALKSVGLHSEIDHLLIPVTGRMMHSKSGNLTYQAYGRDPSECNYSVSRLELNKFLLSKIEAAGVKLNFESPVDSIDFNQKVVSFGLEQKQKEHLQYDILFGADGAGSKVRELLKVASSDFEESVDFLSSGYKELFMPADSQGNSPIQGNALHIWPRATHMLMALANPDNSFTMTLYMPHKAGNAPFSFEQLKTKEDVKAFFESEFPDAIELMPNYLSEYTENPVGLLGTVRCAPWVFGNSVALVGDAAHAIVPFFGQGMNSGFEDCFYLNLFLSEADSDWHQALANYDRLQRSNANAIADMALENFVEMQEKVADPKFLLKKKVEAALEKEFPNEYRSRYGMVTYTLIPYTFCQAVGILQNKILDELTRDIENVEQLDFKRAKKLIDSELVPFYLEHSIKLDRFKL